MIDGFWHFSEDGNIRIDHKTSGNSKFNSGLSRAWGSKSRKWWHIWTSIRNALNSTQARWSIKNTLGTPFLRDWDIHQGWVRGKTILCKLCLGSFWNCCCSSSGRTHTCIRWICRWTCDIKDQRLQSNAVKLHSPLCGSCSSVVGESYIHMSANAALPVGRNNSKVVSFQFNSTTPPSGYGSTLAHSCEMVWK